MPNSLPKTISGLAAVIAGLAVIAACSQAEPTPTATTGPVVTSPISLSPSKDNTLYEDEAGSVSSGEGLNMIFGMTNNLSARRGVIAFDIAANIPAGSTIESVTLTMSMNRTNFTAGPRVVELHALTGDWGEGASNAVFQPGQGIAAAPSDATWLHNFFDTTMWDTPGGDFSTTVSSSTEVDGNGSYTWNSTSQMVSDVQSWLNDPAGNFGWLLMGDETDPSTAKRFDTREALLEENRPVLVIELRRPAAPSCTHSLVVG